MTSQTQDLAAVEARLERLERQLGVETRRNRWLLAAMASVAVGAVLTWTVMTTTPTAQAQGANINPKVIRATQFVLEDENGKSRAALRVIDGGPTLVLGDEKGTVRAALALTRGGPGLSLYDETGKDRVALALTTGGPGLSLYDQNGKDRATLSVTMGGPTLVVSDENGTDRATLSVSRGGPRVSLFDENGKPIWTQP